MKKIISLILSLTMIAGLCTAFSVSAADDTAKAPKITVDGDLGDWEGLATLSVVGTGNFEGKKVTIYGVVTDEGIYLAADAYHDLYKTTEGEWWQNTNFEFFVNRSNNRNNQMWISAKGMSETDTTPLKSHEEMTAAMVTKKVTSGATAYHTVAEVFIPVTLGFVADNIINGNAMVGVAWKTPGDKINNGEANGGGEDEYWVPKKTYPDNEHKAAINAKGIFTQADVDYGNYGINVTSRTFNYWDILKYNYKGGLLDYTEMKKFDESIDALLTVSKLFEKNEKVTSLESSYDDKVKVIKWEGTLTAKDTGDYTLIGRKVDNGFTMFVNGEKVYEFWGCEHWIEGGYLKSDLGSFHVDAGKSYDVEMYFLGLGGGPKSLEMYATTTPDNLDSGANINDAFNFSLTKEHYLSYAREAWSEVLPDGVAGEGTNHGQCVEENFKYSETIGKLLEISTVFETKVIQSISEAAYPGRDYHLIMLDGYLTPKTTGDYFFGAFNVDNGFYMEIDGTTVYEFWANSIYNANAEGNTYPDSIHLEAGKVYAFSAAFLGITGGKQIDLNAKIGDGEAKNVAELFTFTTSHEHEWSEVEVTKEPTCGAAGEGTKTCLTCGETEKVKIPATGEHTFEDGVCTVCGAKEGTPPKTGDVAVFVAAIAIVSLGGAALVVSKKRRYN